MTGSLDLRPIREQNIKIAEDMAKKGIYILAVDKLLTSNAALIAEAEQLREALEKIGKHVDSRLENVNDSLRKEKKQYAEHSQERKRKRSVRVQNALLQDKSSLRHIQTIARQALEGTGDQHDH